MPYSVELFLKKHYRIALDTSVFIYFIESHPDYFPLCNRLFEAVEHSHNKASTSTLSLLEVLVQPYRMNKEELAIKFYALMSTYPHLTWLDMSLNIADLAARLRAKYRLRTPDSIQAASAISSGATGFICNDRAFKKIKEIDVLVLEECL